MGETTQEHRARVRYDQTKRRVSVALQTGQRNQVSVRDILDGLLADDAPREFLLDVMIALTEIFHEDGRTSIPPRDLDA